MDALVESREGWVGCAGKGGEGEIGDLEVCSQPRTRKMILLKEGGCIIDPKCPPKGGSLTLEPLTVKRNLERLGINNGGPLAVWLNSVTSNLTFKYPQQWKTRASLAQ